VFVIAIDMLVSAVERRLRTDLFATISAPATAAAVAPVALPPLNDFP